MKKIILSLAIVFGMSSFTSLEETTTGYEKEVSVDEVVFNCGPNASAISSSCINGCVSIVPRLTGVLEVDVNIANAGPRKPTIAEFQVAQEFLDDFCNS